jgi:hypothetical protein
VQVCHGVFHSGLSGGHLLRQQGEIHVRTCRQAPPPTQQVFTQGHTFTPTYTSKHVVIAQILIELLACAPDTTALLHRFFMAQLLANLDEIVAGVVCVCVCVCVCLCPFGSMCVCLRVPSQACARLVPVCAVMSVQWEGSGSNFCASVNAWLRV